MKRQNINLYKAIIGITFLLMIVTIVACKDRSETIQTGVFQPGSRCSEFDTDPKTVAYYVFTPGIAYLLPF